MAFKLPTLKDTPTIITDDFPNDIAGLASSSQNWFGSTVLDDFDDDMPDFDAGDIFKELPFLQDDEEEKSQQQQPVSEVVVTCAGNINDKDLQDKLRSIQKKISLLAKTGWFRSG